MTPVTSTYRLQLRPGALTFKDVLAHVDYFEALGVSHLYLSPVFTAVAGSTHGYDVTDPTTVSADLGGVEGLAALVAALRERDMGVVVDIVPNHMGVAAPRQNRWWWDVLTHGRGSAYARYFDIDWAGDPDGKLRLPVLGEGAPVVDAAAGVVRYFEHEYPLAPGTSTLQEQAYRLVPWRAGPNYRRFFTVNELAALRQEDPEVFAATHAGLRALVEADLVDGVRVDHPDGLADPVGYLERLRELVGPRRWVVVEKILAVREPLEPELAVDGTTGYDALRELGGVFVHPGAAAALADLAQEFTGSRGDAAALEAEESALKVAAVTTGLAVELGRLVRELGGGQCQRQIAEVVRRLPVYRADYPGAGRYLDAAFDAAAAANPGLPFAALRQRLLESAPASARFAQLSGAAMAKAAEDSLFYRTARLVALQEVGGSPARFGVPRSELHLFLSDHARQWPRTMTTLSTHDTKRGEDVRARVAVLSQLPREWARAVRAWDAAAPCPDRALGYFLWQNIVGVWPVSGRVTGELRERLRSYALKAAREAAVRTTWADPDAAFEGALLAWVDQVCAGQVAEAVTEFVRVAHPHGVANSLGQKLLQLAAPGVPDVYQGTEVPEDCLVDPDNRRPVDFAALAARLDSLEGVVPAEAAKQLVVRAVLGLRRERPDEFVGGDYQALSASGPAQTHVVGFARARAGALPEVLALATRFTASLDPQLWARTVVPLPEGHWVDRFTGVVHTGDAPAAALFAALPVALLVRGGEELRAPAPLRRG